MINTIARKRVQAGAVWLDEILPGWEDKINLQHLDMQDGCNCIIGQAFQEMAVVAQWYAVPGQWENINAFGFFINKFGTLPTKALGFMAGDGLRWEELEDAWVELLKERAVN